MASSPKPTVRLAMIGGLDKNHAITFSKLLNVDWHDEETRRKDLESGFPDMPAEVRVTSAWDEDFAKAEELAKNFGIDHPCRTLEEALSHADAVIIPDDVVMTHQKWALPVMEAGLPHFIDKPLAPSYREAVEIVEQARKHNALMFSSSALAYTRELEALKPQLEEEGGVSLAVATGPNGQFLFYGIHPFSAVYSLFGPGIASVQNTGAPGHHAARIEWKNGKTAVVVVDSRARGFSVMAHTSRGVHTAMIRDSRYFYFNMLVQLVKMTLTREIPIPWEDTLEIIRTLETVEQAAKRGDSSVITFS